jgi:hypothetical protein
MINDNSARPFALIHLAKTRQDDDLELNYIHLLQEVFLRIEKATKFEKGQLICWKPNLKNRNFPEYGEPVIITSILAQPVYDPSEDTASSPYFREPLTLIVGQIVNGDFVEYHVDGRRFDAFFVKDMGS